jgi:hypothetical protein
MLWYNKQNKQTPGLYSASELYWPSDRRLSAKLVPTLADRECRVVNAMNPHGRYFRFSRPEPLLFFQVAPQLSSRGWLGPVPDPLRKSGSAGNRTRDLCICSQELWPLEKSNFISVLLKMTSMSLILNASSVMTFQSIKNSAPSHGTESYSEATTLYLMSNVPCQMFWVLMGPL